MLFGWPWTAEGRNQPMAIDLPDTRSESNEVLEALRRRAVHARALIPDLNSSYCPSL